MEKCVICGCGCTVPHYHHTVPRSRGGDNSEIIKLCSNCHNALHANALSIAARIRNKNRRMLNRRFWLTSIEEENAKPYLEILVRALLTPIQGNRQHLVSINVPTWLFEGLNLLQLDLGISSQAKTLEHCLLTVLQDRGLLDVVHRQETTERIPSTPMWFLQFSDKGKDI